MNQPDVPRSTDAGVDAAAAIRHVAQGDPTDRPTAIRQRRSSPVYDHLLWRLQSVLGDDAGTAYALGLVGCEAKTGVTTIAANLALRAAEQNWGSVLLVETDWYAPRLANLWHVPGQPGAAQLFAGAAPLVECVQPGPVAGLHVVPAGIVSHREQPLVDSNAVREFMAEARVDYRLIIVDLPCPDRLRQELILARLLDQALLVVRAETTRQGEAKRAVRQLQQDGVPLAGAILNRQRSYLPAWLRRRM
ncbi:MAG: CpsD/CapB family tyrosine-protein kinase [Pirellulales bacterium]|nr:CpsD/CapB family tyrosine-protein kinase [Pirellulales bacterium]